MPSCVMFLSPIYTHTHTHTHSPIYLQEDGEGVRDVHALYTHIYELCTIFFVSPDFFQEHGEEWCDVHGHLYIDIYIM
jgi:hypothetical protein